MWGLYAMHDVGQVTITGREAQNFMTMITEHAQRLEAQNQRLDAQNQRLDAERQRVEERAQVSERRAPRERVDGLLHRVDGLEVANGELRRENGEFRQRIGTLELEVEELRAGHENSQTRIQEIEGMNGDLQQQVREAWIVLHADEERRIPAKAKAPAKGKNGT